VGQGGGFSTLREIAVGEKGWKETEKSRGNKQRGLLALGIERVKRAVGGRTREKAKRKEPNPSQNQETEPIPFSAN